MPNHVSNSLTVEGPDADAFFAEIAAAESDDFIGHLIPMPDAIRRSGDGENVTDIERQHMIDLYGTVDWYDWTARNWGTKWASYEVSHEGNQIHFDTAWSPPSVALGTISQMFPNASFTLAFAECGVGFWGMEVHVNGAIMDTHESDEFFRDDVDWDDVADMLDTLTPACAAHLAEYGLGMGG